MDTTGGQAKKRAQTLEKENSPPHWLDFLFFFSFVCFVFLDFVWLCPKSKW